MNSEFLEVRIINVGGRVSYKERIDMSDSAKINNLFILLKEKYGLVLKGNPKNWFD